MKCYCVEDGTQFVYRVECATGETHKRLQADGYWTETADGAFVKEYPLDTDWEDAWYTVPGYKAAIASNFERLGSAWITGAFDWEHVLSRLAQMLTENGLDWYVKGSVSEAVLGAQITPHDIDIVIHTRDFYKARELFIDHTVEPLSDNHGGWLIRYFGKLCLDGASVDIAADTSMNSESYPQLTEVMWRGYSLRVEPLQVRYEVEIQRNRTDRIAAIEALMQRL